MVILADRKFTIEEELATYGATLTIPHFTRGKSQMSAKEVEKSRKISNVRIHVERVIGRLKDLRIMQSIIPITQVSQLENVMVVIAALINMNNSVKLVKVRNAYLFHWIFEIKFLQLLGNKN